MDFFFRVKEDKDFYLVHGTYWERILSWILSCLFFLQDPDITDNTNNTDTIDNTDAIDTAVTISIGPKNRRIPSPISLDWEVISIRDRDGNSDDENEEDYFEL